MSRDAWCTPRSITCRLPLVDLDPCSNSRSTVKARQKIMLERGENGLLIPWTGKTVFVNPPYSDVLPWAKKIVEAESFCFLVNIDPTTAWWKSVYVWADFMFVFGDRLDFDPPPGIDASSNDRASCLLCDAAFYRSIFQRFKGLGRWWKACV